MNMEPDVRIIVGFGTTVKDACLFRPNRDTGTFYMMCAFSLVVVFMSEALKSTHATLLTLVESNWVYAGIGTVRVDFEIVLPLSWKTRCTAPGPKRAGSIVLAVSYKSSRRYY